MPAKLAWSMFMLVLWLSRGYNCRVALLCKVVFNFRLITSLWLPYSILIVFAHYKLPYLCFNAPTLLAGPRRTSYYQTDCQSQNTYMEEQSSSLNLAAWTCSLYTQWREHTLQYSNWWWKICHVWHSLGCSSLNGTKPHPLPWFTILCEADWNRGHPNQGSCHKHSKGMNTVIAWTLTTPSGTQSSSSWNQGSGILKQHSDSGT